MRWRRGSISPGRLPQQGGWPLYAIAVVAGGAAVALSQFWMTGAVAAGVGAALTAVVGVVGERLQPQQQPRAPRRTWPEHLTKAQPGLLPRVHEVTDLADWGVYGVSPGNGCAGSYIKRDVDDQLESALLRGEFVLLVGESAAGKSRTACEAVRRVLPEHCWIRPFTRSSVQVAVDAARSSTRSVLWLDDLESYLGPDGLTEAVIHRIRDHPRADAVLVATIRSEEHRRFDSREGSRLTGADRDLWRAERSVVAQATAIRVERLWSQAEIGRARVLAPDRHLNLALHAAPRFGIAESLSCGPELTDIWRNAWSREANPRGAAIVAAVVDCRRAGLRRPVPLSWVHSDHEGYLNARGNLPGLCLESFEEALTWACRPVRATSSLLTHDSETDSVMAFDYLLSCEGLEPVPEHLWEALLPRVTEEEAYDMGVVAHGEFLLGRARSAFRKARQRPVPGAEFALALVLGDAGRPREAMALLRDLLRRSIGDPLAVNRQLAHFLGLVGEWAEAIRRFRDLAQQMDEQLGADHPDTLGVRHEAAYCTGAAGDPSAAVQELASLAKHRQRILGRDHPDTLATRRSLAWFMGKAGRPAEASTALHELLVEAQPVLGFRDPHVLAIRAALAWLVGEAGSWERAAGELAELRNDRQLILGADHPHTLVTRHQLALAMDKDGDLPGAHELLAQLVLDMRSCLEPEHPDLVAACNSLDMLAARRNASR